MTLGRLYKLNLPAGREPDEQPHSELLFGGTRIPRSALQAMSSAEKVVSDAHAVAAQIHQHSATLLEATRQHAHAQGFSEGKSEAMASVLGTLEAERQLRDLLVQRLTDVMAHCLRQVLGDMGETQVIRQRITQLLSQTNPPSADGATPIRLHVGPQQFALAQEVVAQASQDPTHPIAGLKVVLDETRSADALLLETQVCFVNADLSLTLQEMRDLVGHAMAHARNVLEKTA